MQFNIQIMIINNFERELLIDIADVKLLFWG